MEPCGCHEEQLNSLRTSEGCLLLNYSGLKSFPVNLLCKRHAAKVRRIYAKCNLISSFAQDFHFTYCNVLELYLPLNRCVFVRVELVFNEKRSFWGSLTRETLMFASAFEK